MVQTENYLQLDFTKYILKNYQLDLLNDTTDNLSKVYSHIIEDYIIYKSNRYNLNLLLKIFQSKLIFEKPLISELTFSFNKFIKYPNDGEYLSIEDILKRPYLHGYFKSLIKFLKDKGIIK